MSKTRFLSRRQLLVAAGAGSVFCLDSQSAPAPASRPLYLHWWRPTYYLRDDGSEVKPQLPSRILSTRVVPGQDLSITLGNGSAALSGRIVVGGKRCHAKLEGRFGSTVSLVDADVEVEKPFEGGYLCLSGIRWETRFALSADAECERFLKQ